MLTSLFSHSYPLENRSGHFRVESVESPGSIYLSGVFGEIINVV